MQHKKYTYGFTLIEVLVTLAITVILSTGAIYSFSFFLASIQLNNTTYNVTTSLETARDYTLNHYKGSSNYGVYFTSNQMIVYAGTSYSTSDFVVDTEKLPLGISLSNISFNNQAYVYFQSVTGLPSNSGSLKVSSLKGSKTISVNSNGIININ